MVNANTSPVVLDDRFRFPALKANRKRAMTTNERGTRNVTAQASQLGMRRESLYEERCKFHGGPMASLSEDIEEEGLFAQDSTHREALFRAVDALAIVDKCSEPATVNAHSSNTTAAIEDVRQLRSAVDTAWSALYNAHPRRARAATISTGRTIKRKSVPLPDIDGWSRETVPVNESVAFAEPAAQSIAPSLLFDHTPVAMTAMNPFNSEMRELSYCDMSAEIAPDQRTSESHSWLTGLGGVGYPASGSSASIAELIGIPVSAAGKSKTDKPSRTLRRTGKLFGRLERQSRKARRGSMLITDDMLDDAAATSEENESDLESTPPLADTRSLSSTPGAHSPELHDVSSDGMFGLHPIGATTVDSQDRAVQSPVLNRKTLDADPLRWRPILLGSRENSRTSFNLLGMHMDGASPANNLSSNRF